MVDVFLGCEMILVSIVFIVGEIILVVCGEFVSFGVVVWVVCVGLFFVVVVVFVSFNNVVFILLVSDGDEIFVVDEIVGLLGVMFEEVVDVVYIVGWKLCDVVVCWRVYDKVGLCIVRLVW